MTFFLNLLFILYNLLDFLFLLLSLILRPAFFPALPQFIFSLPALLPRQWLPLKEHLLIHFFFLSVFLHFLPLEVGGLSEKIGPLLPKADGQPHDPGAKGELSARPF